jgi:EAL and modified HD-GYP domain-containing signal transduction protein
MDAFVARQPIFNDNMKVMAYELLFRSGLENVFPDVSGDKATSSVSSDSFINLGIRNITEGHPAFINFTRTVLLEGYAHLFPKQTVVVELLDDIKPDAEILKAVRNLKDEGYRIALDDYSGSEHWEPLIEFADFIKVDFLKTTEEQQESFADRFLAQSSILLAQKVETPKQFEFAKDAGYSLFQGYFFCKPTVMQGKRIPEAKMTKLQLLHAVNKDKVDFQEMEDIIRHDVGLSYKLLRYINSAYFGMRREVTNIKQALVLLGQKNLRKWISLMVCACLGENKTTELLVLAVVRARFCELLADVIDAAERGDEMFLMGLMSTVDALLDMPMDKALEELPLSDELKSALLRKPGQLRNILELVMGYESGNWEQFKKLTKSLSIDEAEVPHFHQEGMKMARQIIEAENAEVPV